jgi:hypothetical protein
VISDDNFSSSSSSKEEVIHTKVGKEKELVKSNYSCMSFDKYLMRSYMHISFYITWSLRTSVEEHTMWTVMR